MYIRGDKYPSRLGVVILFIRVAPSHSGQMTQKEFMRSTQRLPNIDVFLGSSIVTPYIVALPHMQ